MACRREAGQDSSAQIETPHQIERSWVTVSAQLAALLLLLLPPTTVVLLLQQPNISRS